MYVIGTCFQKTTNSLYSVMPSPSSDKQCLACQRSDHETPLVRLAYQGATFWICPQHLPILIHNPRQLTGLLPGAENMNPADTHD